MDFNLKLKVIRYLKYNLFKRISTFIISLARNSDLRLKI